MSVATIAIAELVGIFTQYAIKKPETENTAPHIDAQITTPLKLFA